MPTKRAFISPQGYTELYGIVIGLDGDPANQVPANKGTDKATAFSLIQWAGSTDPVLSTLIWSRLLLVEILTPYDNYVASRLALVVRPRSLWLYEKDNSTYCADFVGNTSKYTDVGTAGHTTEIVQVNPPYRYGDVIRIGVLPAPIILHDSNNTAACGATGHPNWCDNFIRSRTPNETYNGSTPRTYGITSDITNFTIKGASVNAQYSNFAVNEVLYYDKNVDARTRIVGGSAAPAGETVTLSLCIGGVTRIYEVTGQRIL